MRQAARVSPFAAMTNQEKLAQWIVWQSQQDMTRPVMQHDANRIESVSEEATRVDSKTDRSRLPHETIHSHHGQYDAVIRRMANAQRGAIRFVDANHSPESTRQPASGSE